MGSTADAATGLSTTSAAAVAQTVADVNNPSSIEFTVSIDHAVVTLYEMDILRPDGTVLQTLNLSKPTPDASNKATVAINVQPIAFAAGYRVRVRAFVSANGSNLASDYAVSLNKFNRVPGPPSGVVSK